MAPQPTRAVEAPRRPQGAQRAAPTASSSESSPTTPPPMTPPPTPPPSEPPASETGASPEVAMAVLNAVPGDPLANAYVTVVQATAFLTMRLQTGLDRRQCVRPGRRACSGPHALSMSRCTGTGVPTYPDQALALPQVGLVDQWGRSIASNVIPVPVQQATALYALGAAGGECRGCARGRRFDHQK